MESRLMRSDRDAGEAEKVRKENAVDRADVDEWVAPGAELVAFMPGTPMWRRFMKLRLGRWPRGI